MFKRLFFFGIIILISLTAFCQYKNDSEKPIYDFSLTVYPKLVKRLAVLSDCSPILANSNCNIVRNNDFDHTLYNPNDQQHVNDPFGLDLVPEWYPSHGSANIYGPNFLAPIPPPIGISSYFFGGVGQIGAQGGGGAFYSEGIVQKITATIPGHRYVLSFFKAKTDYSNNPYVGTNDPIDILHITLINCEDYISTFNPNSYSYPVVPANSQPIFCETGMSNNNWEQVFVNFTATSNYNMIWIYPEENPTPGKFSGLYFAHPELIDITASFAQTLIGTPPNCQVLLPHCGPINSVFTWTGPNGQIISGTVNQPLQINTSTDYGLWTLQMTVPGSLNTNNTCSDNTSLQANIYVPQCGGSWPKAYETKPSQSFFKTDDGNILLQMAPLPSTPYINHNGVYAGYLTATTLQYNLTGLTSWYTNLYTFFPLHNGSFQMSDHNYYNPVTGQAVLGPFLVPSNERIIAETSTGGYISSDEVNSMCWECGLFYVGQIFLHATSGTSTPIAVNSYAKTVFNPTTNRLYIISDNNLKLYSVTGNTMSLISQTSFLGEVAQITNTDKVYVVRNGQLEELNYSGSIGTYALVSALGFNNSSIGSNYSSGTYSDNPYTENRVLVTNTSDNFLYVVDLRIMISKKINISSPPLFNSRYAFVNDNLYLTFSAEAPYIIGTQQIPLLGSPGTLCVFTKLNLQTDFSFSADPFSTLQSPLQATIFPNPSKDWIQIYIKDNILIGEKKYTIIFRNKLSSKILIQKDYYSGNTINISHLDKGFQYVEIIDSQGNRDTKKFIKL
jgi:hypothetical protein